MYITNFSEVNLTVSFEMDGYNSITEKGIVIALTQSVV